jgi:hypothetical protein
VDRYHILQWESDGEGGWTHPRLVDHAADLGEAEEIYREIMAEWGRTPPPGYVRLEIVRAVRHRDYRPDKPG